ncbi:MAG: hypothetical protein IPI67_03040 [Myxococcales bacterium]|nr:hypothetical protein [Myxococcales bacterium]
MGRLCLFAAPLLSACGSDDDGNTKNKNEPCEVTAQTGCKEQQVCCQPRFRVIEGRPS